LPSTHVVGSGLLPMTGVDAHRLLQVEVEGAALPGQHRKLCLW